MPGAEHDLLADLTPAQREAVTHLEGPLLILAGAGSGKTRVITRRVAYLIRQGVKPWNILAITFTNKAAGEMRQRIGALVPDSPVWISTFHSLGARLLRQHGDRFGLDRKNDPDLRAELDSRFRFVLIDEYQDTNKAQYAIARHLSLDQPNLCVVGDPDQSIYAFRGSDIRNILDFERDFPDARVITLDLNYRSTKSILRAASHLIAHNRERKPKDLITENPQGKPVSVLTFETGVEEAEGVARRIKEAVEKDRRSYRDFAVFLRINALSRGVEMAFVKQ